jgi:hypothetical protein
MRKLQFEEGGEGDLSEKAKGITRRKDESDSRETFEFDKRDL